MIILFSVLGVLWFCLALVFLFGYLEWISRKEWLRQQQGDDMKLTVVVAKNEVDALVAPLGPAIIATDSGYSFVGSEVFIGDTAIILTKPGDRCKASMGTTWYKANIRRGNFVVTPFPTPVPQIVKSREMARGAFGVITGIDTDSTSCACEGIDTDSNCACESFIGTTVHKDDGGTLQCLSDGTAVRQLHGDYMVRLLPKGSIITLTVE